MLRVNSNTSTHAQAIDPSVALGAVWAVLCVYVCMCAMRVRECACLVVSVGVLVVCECVLKMPCSY